MGAFLALLSSPVPEPCTLVRGSGRESGRGRERTQGMRSEEAQIGAGVRVSDSGLHSELRGLTGTVSGLWGHPKYLALDVRMEDGRLELFWHYELEEIAERA